MPCHRFATINDFSENDVSSPHFDMAVGFDEPLAFDLGPEHLWELFFQRQLLHLGQKGFVVLGSVHRVGLVGQVFETSVVKRVTQVD
jgi:hypothetical protein